MFKSLVAVGNAEVSDLMNVNGVGEKKASDIYSPFNRGTSLIPKEQYVEAEKKEEESAQRRLL